MCGVSAAVFNSSLSCIASTPTSATTQQDPYYNIPAIIAINMIMAAASGGTFAILIATWAQVRRGKEDTLSDSKHYVPCSGKPSRVKTFANWDASSCMGDTNHAPKNLWGKLN